MKTGKTLRNFLLVLAALALVVFLTVSFGLFSPSSHMWPSRVEDGRLHYTKTTAASPTRPARARSCSVCPGDLEAKSPRRRTASENAASLSARTRRSCSKTAKTSCPRA